MTEHPLFFEHGGRRLFGIVHEATSPSAHPFVFCHPFGEEKLWTQRAFVSFARELAARGHHVLRFDYAGNGDSDGAFSDSSMNTALDDVRGALAFMRQRTGQRQIGLLGLRLGATIASLIAETDQEIASLVLWAPIVDGAKYMQELLRVNLTTQMATYKEIRQDRTALVAAMEAGHSVNVDGYDITLPMYREVSAVQLDAPKSYRGPCLVVQIDPRPGRPAPELGRVAGSYSAGMLTFAQEEPFWKEIPRFYGRAPNLTTVTVDWLARRAGVAA